MKKKYIALAISLYLIMTFTITTIVYAKWIATVREDTNPIVDSTYKVELIDGSNVRTYELLEIESYFYLPYLEDDLENEKFFLGWALEEDETLNFISNGDYKLKDYNANLINNKLTFYAIYTNTIPTGKTLIKVNYPTNQKIVLLVDNSKVFYLFNVNVPDKIDTTFLSYFTSVNNYNYTKYSGVDSVGNRFELNDYFKSEVLINNNKIELTAVYE